MRYQWIFAVPLVFACSAALPQATPGNTDSEYFRTSGTGTLLNKNVVPTDIVFHLNLKVKKPLPRNAVMVAEFENPIPKAAPVEVVLDPVPDQQELSISSPGMACLTNNKYYRTIVTLFSDSSRRQVLSTHVQIIATFVPQPMFEVMKVSACPAY